ncbi:MAG: hypothetical protein QOE64_599 [Frankiales bacterium]|nr:hypothetical protein [Frankiales bacterium]
MRRLLVLVLVLVGGLVVVDRLAVHSAQRQIAVGIRASQGLSSTPTVTISGFPFLTQVVNGRYSEVDISGVGLVRGRLRASRVDAELRGVDLALGDALRGRVGAVPVDSVTLTAALPWTTLQAVAPEPVGLSAAHGGVRVVSSVSGRTLVFTADAMLQGGQIVLVPREVAGRTVRLGAPDLPFGLRLTKVRVTNAGLVVSAAGRRVVVSG